MPTDKNPRIILINSERELANLIPGDCVKVKVGEKPEWMFYEGVHEGKHSFLKKSGQDEGIPFFRSERRFLQFPGNYVSFDSFHNDSGVIDPSSPSYGSARSIVDVLD